MKHLSIVWLFACTIPLCACGPHKQQDAIEDGSSKPQPTPQGQTPVNELSVPATTATPVLSAPSEQPIASPVASETPSATASPAVSGTASPAPSSSESISPAKADSSDALPVFKSQAANEYLRAYEDYINQFKQAYQALKRGDLTKYRKVVELTQEMQSKGEVIDGELSPEEQKQLAAYMDKKANELALYASQNP